MRFYFCVSATLMPNAINNPPKILLKVFWNFSNTVRIRFSVRKIATNENQRIVSTTMIRLMIPRVIAGVPGVITSVKSPRKKRVTFGFRTFVKKPLFSAASDDRSVFLVCSPMSILVDFVVSDLKPT